MKTIGDFKDVSDATKSVYTQAMCDAGNVALIGMQVSYPSGKGELALGADNEGDCIVIEDGRYKRVDFSILKPIQTEREIIIEKAAKVLREYESGVTELVRGLDMFIGPATALFKAGLLK